MNLLGFEVGLSPPSTKEQGDIQALLARGWGCSSQEGPTSIGWFLMPCSSPSLAVSRPQTSPEDLKALMGNVNRLNESFRDMQLKLLQLPLKGDMLDHIWRLQDLLQNHSDSLFLMTGSLQKLEGLLWSLQTQASQTDKAVSNLWDSLTQQSDAAQQEMYKLSVEGNSSRLLLQHHDHLLSHLGSRVESLSDQVTTMSGTVDTMNRTFSYDVNIHHTRIKDLQVLISNATEDARQMRLIHIAMEEQLKHELAILNNVTEDLRLKDWEHSIALNNISVIRGKPSTSCKQVTCWYVKVL